MQTCTIFFNEKELILSKAQLREIGYSFDISSEENLGVFISGFLNKEAINPALIFGGSVDLILKKLQKQFKNIEAAGGLVFNAKNEFLLIKRLGKADLPKGKIEKGEDPKTAALREVEEECEFLACE